MDNTTTTMPTSNKETTARRLGQALKAARLKRGVGQAKLGLQIGLLPLQISRLEAPVGDVLVGTVARLADAFGLELALVPAETSGPRGSCGAESKVGGGE